MILNHKLHVLARKEDLDTVRLPDKVVIVLDILFATTTITAAMARGATCVVPAMDGPAAVAEAGRHAPGTYVLAGELHAVTLEGFAAPTPLALCAHGVEGKAVIYSTTNGTIALNDAAAAPHVYAGSMLNAGALVEHVLAKHPDRTVLIVCSGSMGNFNYEDWFGAGCLVDLFARALGPAADLSDAALAARAVFAGADPFESLIRCRVGRMMSERGLAEEVRFATRISSLDVVPRLEGRVLRRAG